MINAYSAGVVSGVCAQEDPMLVTIMAAKIFENFKAGLLWVLCSAIDAGKTNARHFWRGDALFRALT
jgi:hypothetical protein